MQATFCHYSVVNSWDYSPEEIFILVLRNKDISTCQPPYFSTEAWYGIRKTRVYHTGCTSSADAWFITNVVTPDLSDVSGSGTGEINQALHIYFWAGAPNSTYNILNIATRQRLYKLISI